LEPTELLLDPTEPLLDPTELLLDLTELILEPTELILEPTEPILSPHKSLFYNELSALRASLGRGWRAFLPALHGLRILLRTSRKGTAFGCLQTTPKGFMPRAANACDVR
jgi:hypothetical protein